MRTKKNGGVLRTPKIGLKRAKVILPLIGSLVATQNKSDKTKVKNIRFFKGFSL